MDDNGDHHDVRYEVQHAAERVLGPPFEGCRRCLSVLMPWSRLLAAFGTYRAFVSLQGRYCPLVVVHEISGWTAMCR